MKTDNLSGGEFLVFQYMILESALRYYSYKKSIHWPEVEAGFLFTQEGKPYRVYAEYQEKPFGGVTSLWEEALFEGEHATRQNLEHDNPKTVERFNLIVNHYGLKEESVPTHNPES